MQKRTWTYGTELDVKVFSATKTDIVVICEKINEGFILVNHGVKDLPKKDDEGKIIFTKGGPTGGYWSWKPANSVKDGKDN